MVSKESIFLSIDQAVEAVCADFQQYEPQIMLFAEIIRLISGGNIFLKKETQKNGAWIGKVGQRKMQWLDGPDLVTYMCNMIVATDWNPELMASICSRVFRTHAFPDVDSASGQAGVRIETGMETYCCCQCGQCCQALEYHDQVTVKDVERWQRLGRTDILKWVGTHKKGNGRTAYRIWIRPDTKELAETCPFLQKNSSKNIWVCNIHDVKPAICRQYPVSRKHGLMTGCPGFNAQCRKSRKK